MTSNESPLAPTDIEGRERILRITWTDGVVTEPTYLALRRSCRCAQCVEEMTGRPLLDPGAVPDDVHPVAIRQVGSYAIQFTWSDGHGSGLYTYAHLREARAG